jgi:hypothetical protein
MAGRLAAASKVAGDSDKSRKNKISVFPVLMGVTGMVKSRPASRLCLKYQCPTL